MPESLPDRNCLLCGCDVGDHADRCPFEGVIDTLLIRRVADELDSVAIQRDDLGERLDRIRAAAESDADLAKLPAVRDFLLTETPRAAGGSTAWLHITPEMLERYREAGTHHAA